MGAVIAYKDCKTPADYACYKQHVKALEDALLAANELRLSLLAAGLIDLAEQTISISDKIGSAIDDYCSDEIAETLEDITAPFAEPSANNSLIPISQYASKIGRDPATVRQKCLRGALPGAVKIGRNWLIPADTAYPDKRVSSGRYIGSSKTKPNS